MPAEQFLRWLLDYLRREAIARVGWIDFPHLDTPDVFQVADAIAMALEFVRATPTDTPQPIIGWLVRCNECTYEPIRWQGIAFSPDGAEALLLEHRAHCHTPALPTR